MSYVHLFFVPGDSTEPGLAQIHRYRVEKSPGKAVILTEQGGWSDPDPTVAMFYPPFHQKEYNCLHLDGRVNFAKDAIFQERYLMEDANYIGLDENTWHWNPVFNVLDNM